MLVQLVVSGETTIRQREQGGEVEVRLTEARPVNRRPRQDAVRNVPWVYDSDLLVTRTADMRGWTLTDRTGKYTAFGTAAVPGGTLMVIHNGGTGIRRGRRRGAGSGCFSGCGWRRDRDDSGLRGGEGVERIRSAVRGCGVWTREPRQARKGATVV